MKKKGLSLFLALAMCLPLLPLITLAAEETEHVHYLCGGDSCTGIGHSEESKVTFDKWEKTDSLPNQEGAYYLDNDVTLTKTWVPANGTTLCLNGHSITMNADTDSTAINPKITEQNAVISLYGTDIDNRVTFNLTDCNGSREGNGIITHAEGKLGRGVFISGYNLWYPDVFNMYGGSITGNTTQQHGAGVYAYGTFNMYGGSVADNHIQRKPNTIGDLGQGAGVSFSKIFCVAGNVKIVDNTTTFNGEISGTDLASNVYSGGNLTLNVVGKLDENARIGLIKRYYKDGGNEKGTGKAVTTENTDYMSRDNFNCDREGYGFTQSEDGKTISVAKHKHEWVYATAQDAENKIIATCKNSDKLCDGESDGSLTISPPEDLNFSNSYKQAVVTRVNWSGKAYYSVYYTKNGQESHQSYDADIYTARITLRNDDGTTAIAKVTYTINPINPTADDFVFTVPTDLTYDGTAKQANVTVNGYKGVGKITVKYYKDGELVDEAKDAGIYQVKIDTTGGNNYYATSDISVDDWTFTITKGTPTAPNGLVGLKDQKLSTVALPDGWVWVDGEQVMSASGSQTFKATHPGSDNYNSVAEADVTVTVSDKTNAGVSFTGTNSFAKTYGDEDFTITAKAASIGKNGTWNWNCSDPTALQITANSDTATVKILKATRDPVTITAVYDSDTTFGSAQCTVTVAKAKSTGTPEYTKITESGKTLADAELKIGTITPAGGTIVWNDGADTVVEANKAYGWTYTPVDTVNYETLTGNITPYVVSSSFGGGSHISNTSYTVSTSATNNGTITSNVKTARKGSTVTITVQPDSGYKLDKLTVVDSKNNAVALTDKGNGTYTFTMPDSKVEIMPSFVKDTATEPEMDRFMDVNSEDYFFEAVKWAAEKGITGGIGKNLFGPSGPCTRAQIVTFLWRAAGSPDTELNNNFSDVSANAYYAEAVAWAVENGITTGISGDKFSPDMTCTRAQAVTFLYRFAKAQTSGGASDFRDVAANAYYAAAVKWATENNITNGIGSGLFGSNDDCTRAQIVTFLWRLNTKN